MGMFSKFFKASSDDTANEANANVKLGDKYFQVGGTESLWQVERLFKPTISDVPHVELVRLGKMPTSKVISLSVLVDSEIFSLDRRKPENEDTEKKRKARRKSDTKVQR